MKDSERLNLIGRGLAWENVTKAKTNSAGKALLEIAPRVEALENCMAAAQEAANEIARMRKLLNLEYENKLNFFNVLNKYWPGTVSELLEDHARLKDALKCMTQLEPCECGCASGKMPVLMKPHHYYAIARDALGNGVIESRDSEQNGQTGSAQAKPENSDMESVCHDIAPSPNV